VKTLLSQSKHALKTEEAAFKAGIKVYFVRHADKAVGNSYNARLRHQDQAISSRGRKQSKDIRKYFGNKGITSIFVSEYLRTTQTIAPLAKRLKIVPTVDPRLNEIDLGNIDGMTDEDFKAKYPHIWKAYQDRNADFRWPGGETGSEAQARIVNFLEELKEKSGNCIAVAHDGVIRLLFCHLMQIPVYRRFDLQIGTACAMEIEWNQDSLQWNLLRYNQELN
jgi:probable phosphoglycerate mutase